MVCEMFKTDFQDGGCGGHLGSLLDTILAHFNPEVVLCYRASFGPNQPKVWEKMSKIYFQDGGCGGYLVFSIGSVLAILLAIRHPNAPHQVSTHLDHSL